MSVTEDRTKLGKFLKMRFLRGTYVFDQKIMDKLIISGRCCHLVLKYWLSIETKQSP